MLGIDVAGLDVASFLAAARRLYPLLALLWLLALLRVKRPAWLLVGVIVANAYAWGVTNYPLQRLYALGPSQDRLGNLAFCQVVAAGNPPLHTAQVGQLHFEPFWGLLVAGLSGWDPDRVLRLYPFFPLTMATGFVLLLYFGLKSPEDPQAWSAWERALAAGFATLLCSPPMDFAGTYRVPWAMTFLLKPNHALGLVLFPLILRAFLSIRGWAGRIAVGFLLHLLGWVFVLHMVYVSAGLVVFAALSLLSKQADAGRSLRDVLVVLGVNLLIVSPYLYMLVVGYPFLRPSERMMVPPWSPHLLEPTLAAGWVFPLGVWGLVVAQRRGDRLGRLWVSQLAGAFLLWTGYLGLSLLKIARERDELHYWLRFLLAASAGIGAWDLAGRASEWLRRGVVPPALRAAAVGVLALPWSFPYWWDPVRMDPYFQGSIPPVPDLVRLPTDFFRRKTPPDAVVAGDRDFARYVAALGARRVLLASNLHAPRDYDERARLEERLVRGSEVEAARAAASAYGVRYLVVTPKVLREHSGITLEDLRRRPDLEGVHLTGEPGGEFVAVFELRGPRPAEPAPAGAGRR